MSDHVKKGQKHQNREAFKAHRNIKRAVRDVDAEAALKQKACADDARKRCDPFCFLPEKRYMLPRRTEQCFDRISSRP